MNLKPQDKREPVKFELKLEAQLFDQLSELSRSLNNSDPKYVATELIRSGIGMASRALKSPTTGSGKRGRPKAVQAVA